jgi:phosphotransferase system HPr-like phosphotransfer protein
VTGGSLGVQRGDQVAVAAQGPAAEDVLDRLAALLETA